jgi:hypothetical protein
MRNYLRATLMRLAPGQRRLRTHLVLPALACFVPVLLLAAFAVWQAASSYREASATRMTDR